MSITYKVFADFVKYMDFININMKKTFKNIYMNYP